MASPTTEQLYSHSYSCSDLVAMVTAAISFTNGVTATQKSGIERFYIAINDPSSNSTPQKLVENFFQVFDDLFFGRNLRYGVTAKLEIKPSPVNTCCKGLAPGGRLIVQVDDISTTSTATLLGRLLHDMIHAFLWRYAHREFINNDLFANGWGFSGHGTAWQDIAIAIEGFTKQYLLPLDLGRNEALGREFTQFSERLKLEATTTTTSGDSAVTSTKQTEAQVTQPNESPVPVTNQEVIRPRRGSPPIRSRFKRLTKPMPAHVEKARSQKVEPAYSLPADDLKMRGVLKEAADCYIEHLFALETETCN